MTIKDLKEILIHFQDKKYDDYEVILWDYNHQQTLDWGVSHSLSHPDKELIFPVTVNPVDGITIEKRLKKVVEQYESSKGKSNEMEWHDISGG